MKNTLFIALSIVGLTAITSCKPNATVEAVVNQDSINKVRIDDSLRKIAEANQMAQDTLDAEATALDAAKKAQQELETALAAANASKNAAEIAKLKTDLEAAKKAKDAANKANEAKKATTPKPVVKPVTKPEPKKDEGLNGLKGGDATKSAPAGTKEGLNKLK